MPFLPTFLAQSWPSWPWLPRLWRHHWCVRGEECRIVSTSFFFPSPPLHQIFQSNRSGSVSSFSFFPFHQLHTWWMYLTTFHSRHNYFTQCGLPDRLLLFSFGIQSRQKPNENDTHPDLETNERTFIIKRTHTQTHSRMVTFCWWPGGGRNRSSQLWKSGFGRGVWHSYLFIFFFPVFFLFSFFVRCVPHTRLCLSPNLDVKFCVFGFLFFFFFF